MQGHGCHHLCFGAIQVHAGVFRHVLWWCGSPMVCMVYIPLGTLAQHCTAMITSVCSATWGVQKHAEDLAQTYQLTGDSFHVRTDPRDSGVTT